MCMPQLITSKNGKVELVNKKILIALGLSCFIATESAAAAMFGRGARQVATQGFRQMARRGVQTAVHAGTPVTETVLTVAPQASKQFLVKIMNSPLAGRFKEMVTAKGFNVLDAAAWGSALLGAAAYFESQPAYAQDLIPAEQQGMALLKKMYTDDVTFEERQALGAELKKLLAIESMTEDLYARLILKQAELRNEQEKRLTLRAERQRARELAKWRFEDEQFMEELNKDLRQEADLDRTIRSADSLAQRVWSSVPSGSELGAGAHNMATSLWNSLPSRELLSGYIPSMGEFRVVRTDM